MINAIQYNKYNTVQCSTISQEYLQNATNTVYNNKSNKNTTTEYKIRNTKYGITFVLPNPPNPNSLEISCSVFSNPSIPSSSIPSLGFSSSSESPPVRTDKYVYVCYVRARILELYLLCNHLEYSVL